MSEKYKIIKEAIEVMQKTIIAIEKELGIEEDRENDASTSSTQPLYKDDNGEFTAADIVKGYKPKGKIMPASLSDRFRDLNYGIKNVRK
jgi:fructose/tagatose bisphosphate aldolase